MKRAIGVCLGLLSIVLAACLGGGAGAFLYSTYHAPEQPAQTKSQSEQLLDVKSFGKLRSRNRGMFIGALGRLKPRGDVIDIAGGMMGARLARLKVEVGQFVKAGTTLGFLDGYDEASVQCDAAEAQLADAKARLEAEDAYSEIAIAQAEIGVHEATKLDPLDIQAQEARVALLESALATERKDLERLLSVATGTISAQRRDQEDLAVRRDEQELKAAKTLLAKTKAGTEFKLQAAQKQLEAAKAARRRVRASGQLNSLAQNVSLAKAHRDRLILKAPRDGRILEVLTREGESADRRPILKMGDTRVMYAVAEVYETDVRDVTVGQTATVSSAALDKDLKGKVESIGRMVFKNDVLHVDPAADVDARVVEVWIALESTDENVADLTNLQVDVKIRRTITDAPDGAGEPTQAGERKESR